MRPTIACRTSGSSGANTMRKAERKYVPSDSARCSRAADAFNWAAALAAPPELWLWLAVPSFVPSPPFSSPALPVAAGSPDAACRGVWAGPVAAVLRSSGARAPARCRASAASTALPGSRSDASSLFRCAPVTTRRLAVLMFAVRLALAAPPMLRPAPAMLRPAPNPPCVALSSGLRGAPLLASMSCGAPTCAPVCHSAHTLSGNESSTSSSTRSAVAADSSRNPSTCVTGPVADGTGSPHTPSRSTGPVTCATTSRACCRRSRAAFSSASAAPPPPTCRRCCCR
mmetsp:Transcript_17254/g.53575  ORF Transcript_17254/g.53575 Transcript_17254/m.53575 type:complete len:285 (-) Transcript_17254:1675-2529(-)